MISTRRGVIFSRASRALTSLCRNNSMMRTRIGAWDGDKRALRRNQAIGDQTVQMGMKPRRVVAIGLQRRDHAGQGSGVLGGILEKFPDRGIKRIADRDLYYETFLRRTAVSK